MYLNFPRTLSSRVRCTFPGCKKTTSDRLYDASRSVRFKVMKERNIYIPVGARVCYKHLNPIEWKDIILQNKKMVKFTQRHVEDAIQLLCNSESNIDSKSPGWLCMFYFLTRNISIRLSHSNLNLFSWSTQHGHNEDIHWFKWSAI